MKKLFFLPVIFLATSFAATAQNTRIGFTAGAVFANYHSKVEGESDNGDSKIGITAGVLFDISAGKQFSFQPALNFVQKGSKSKETYGGSTMKASINVNTIEIPLNLVYNAGGTSGSFFFGAGPSLAFAISGKVKFDDGSTSVEENLKFGNTDNDDIKGMDLGLNIMTGYCFQNGLLCAVNYNRGLSNLVPGGSANGTTKSNYFGIKLGYLLNKGIKK